MIDEPENIQEGGGTDKTSGFDYKTIEKATRPYLLRLTEEPTKDEKHPKRKVENPHQIKGRTIESLLLGTFYTANKEKWKILGMRARRETAACSTEYEVHRYERTFNIDGVEFQEQMPCEKRTAVLRLCRYDAPNDHKVFWNEYETLKYVRSKMYQKRHLDAFPSIFATGEFSHLNFLESHHSGAARYSQTKLEIPRPYYIIEKVEPSLDCIQNSSKYTRLSVGTACYLTIGCLRALRILHQLGIVHRNIQPSSFSVRLGCTGMLQRREAELAEKVVITDFSLCRRTLHEDVKPRRILQFIGNFRYSSVNAMQCNEQTSVDDVISCIYMLHEFCAGSLPWALETDKKVIIEKKNSVEQEELKDDGGIELLANYKELYVITRKSNGFEKQINYDLLTNQLLESCEGKKGDHSLFGFQYPLFNSYRHGFTTNDGRAALPQGVGVEKEDFLGKGEAILGGKHTKEVKLEHRPNRRNMSEKKEKQSKKEKSGKEKKTEKEKASNREKESQKKLVASEKKEKEKEKEEDKKEEKKEEEKKETKEEDKKDKENGKEKTEDKEKESANKAATKSEKKAEK